jgi:hypothetical protein
MKTFLRFALGCALVTIFAFSRFLYVHYFHNVHNKQTFALEAADPINMIALLSFFLFGTATLILLLCAAVWFLVRLLTKNPN